MASSDFKKSLINRYKSVDSVMTFSDQNDLCTQTEAHSIGIEPYEPLEQPVTKTEFALPQQSVELKDSREEIDNLRHVLEEKTRELSLVTQDLAAAKLELERKQQEVSEAREKGKQDAHEMLLELKAQLDQTRQRLRDAVVHIDEERKQGAACKEEAASLRKTLEDSKKIEAQLERFLREETEKNKKLREQLEFLVYKTNEEKDSLSRKFREFRDSAACLMRTCEAHSEEISNLKKSRKEE